jgi:hypothetical protein
MLLFDRRQSLSIGFKIAFGNHRQLEMSQCGGAVAEWYTARKAATMKARQVWRRRWRKTLLEKDQVCKGILFFGAIISLRWVLLEKLLLVRWKLKNV